MALGAEYEQTARLADFVRFGRYLCFELLFKFAETAAVFEYLGVVGVRIRRRLVYLPFLKPFVSQRGFRHEFGVAAQLDIGAAPRHIGGDRHRADFAGLGDYLGFFFVVFGV